MGQTGSKTQRNGGRIITDERTEKTSRFPLVKEEQLLADGVVSQVEVGQRKVEAQDMKESQRCLK